MLHFEYCFEIFIQIENLVGTAAFVTTRDRLSRSSRFCQVL